MNLKQSIAANGGLVKSAALLGVSPQRLHNWVQRGVPAGRCIHVALVLGADLRSLRHNAADIWPELAEQA